MIEENASEELGDEVESSSRSDFQPANVKPKKKRGRPPKVRHDSAAAATAPINGFGQPFEVRTQPGWRGYWVSDSDLERMSHRPWARATWGDPRVIAYGGRAPGSKGEPIKYRELSLMLMSEANAIALVQNDPQREAHRQKREFLKMDAQRSGDNRYRGQFRESIREL